MLETKSFVFRFDDFEVREGEFCLVKSGELTSVEPKAFRVLLILLRNPNKLIAKDELLRAVWGDTAVTENSLARSIALLRRLLGDDTRNPRYIETVSTVGYRFIAPVKVEGGSAVGFAPGFQSAAGEAQAIVATPASPGVASGTVTSVVRGKRRFWQIISAAAVTAGLAVGFWYLRSPMPLPQIINAVRITNDGRAKLIWFPPVTDGLHLYFLEGMPWTSGSGIAQLSVTGGETTWIDTTPHQISGVFAVSPNRSELLIGGDHGLWIQPLPGGSPRRVGNVRATTACWTPDGGHIIYADPGSHAIMLANSDGGDPHQLAGVSGDVMGIRFSPDGGRIRFTVGNLSTWSISIWEMSANGGDAHALLQDWKESQNPCCGNWSPDGKYYYFQAEHGETRDIWVLPERPSIFHRAVLGPSRLTHGPLRFSAPSPSSDGKRLFVVGEEPRVELVSYDLKTKRFDPFLPGLSAGPIDFSPDGKWIAYVAYPEMTLWRCRVDGSDKQQLTFPPVRAFLPRWSPDASRIAFTDFSFSHPSSIFLISSSGGSLEPLVKAESGGADVDPTWDPGGGDSIVFGRSRWIDGSHLGIFRVDLKTRKVSAVPDSTGLYSPRVSPDGRYISALKDPDDKLVVFDTKEKRWRTLAGGEQRGFTEWSHDGKYVYFRETRDGAAAVARVRVSDGKLESVLSLRGFPQRIDILALWIGMSPGDAPLLMRDRSVQEIYALDLRNH